MKTSAPSNTTSTSKTTHLKTEKIATATFLVASDIFPTFALMNPSKHSSTADLQVRKLSLIEWLARVDDEKTISEFEAVQKKRRVENYEKSLKPMTQAELIRRAKRANKEIAEGKYVTTEELEREAATW